ncbi:hypothetical protein SELMODRAFT_404188 [Selaginella moellendorffii]|uniref:Uncharacterized protein n=1 Tax=Selaginella moellendorffii TaxID=88036 RepID=D8QUJ4_SELML|nr:hypothetical protein SELMODRAFT_404188 [Selaginella moellendorffii]
MDKLLWHCLSLEPEQELLVVGPKGTGKSCRLRAMAAALYASGPERLIVCLWSMESVRSPALLLEWLLVGLRFAYSGADEHNPVLEALQRMKEDMEDENVRKRVARLQKFLKERAAAGEDLTFVADGAEALDTCDYRSIEKMDAGELKDTFLTLEAIVAPYKIVWGVSPEARQAQAAALSGSERVEIYRVRGFTKGFSVLGAVVAGDRQRTEDMDFFAGFHPQFLDELDGACMERVLLEFVNGRTMSSIRRSVQEVVRRLDDVKARCDLHCKTQTIGKDPRYSLSEDV